MMDSRKMRGTELIPTRANMVGLLPHIPLYYFTHSNLGQLREMRKLVEDAQYGDRFVFHCASHFVPPSTAS